MKKRGGGGPGDEEPKAEDKRPAIAAYIAYKLKAAMGDDVLTVTAGRPVRFESYKSRIAFTVKFGSSHDEISKPLQVFLNKTLPEALGKSATVAHDPWRKGSDTMVIYVNGTTSHLSASNLSVGLFNAIRKEDKDGLTASQLVPEVRKDIGGSVGRGIAD